MNIASLQVRIGADIKQLQSAMQRAQTSIRETGERMEQMGKTLTTRVTAPIAAMGAVAVRAFGVQEKAELQLRAALQANGRAVDELFDSYNEFASEMQRITVVGDETTLSMLAQAESLGLTADSAQRAVKNSIAMQSAFGVNAESALRYTAALEQGNATMLTRYIPALREIDDESERVAKAQEILGNAFSAAEAEAQGSTGQFTQMRNALGDLMEDIGEIISKAIMPIVNHIKEWAENAQKTDKRMLALGVAVAAVVAAVGPALMLLGKLAGAIAFLISPIGLVIGATAALSAAILYVWDNWDAVVERISDITWWRNALIDMVQWFLKYNPTALLLKGFNAILERFGMKIPDPFKGLADSLELLKGEQTEYEHEFGSFMDAVRNGAAAVKEWLAGMFEFDGSTLDEATDNIERIERATVGRLFDPVTMSARDMTVAVETSGGAMARVLKQNQDHVDKLARRMDIAEHFAIQFTDSFGQGMANVVVQGERLVDVLRNIGRLLLSSAIQTGLRILLTGGVGGGITGGFFGRLFGVNDALITSGGDVVKFHPDDNILAMKDFSGLGGGGGDIHVTGELVARGDELRATLIETDRRQSRGGI